MICRDTPTHGWVCAWMDGWFSGSMGGSGHITKYLLKIYDLLDIFDIFLDILLKPLQPLMGLFFSILYWIHLVR